MKRHSAEINNGRDANANAASVDFCARYKHYTTVGALNRAHTYTSKAQHLTAYFCVYSYSKLPKKTTPLYTYKKRKALADAVRELEQEQAQQVNTRDTNNKNRRTTIRVDPVSPSL